MRWFGESWGAPVNTDVPHAPTPVGALCANCSVTIADGDQGYLIPDIVGAPGTEVNWVERPWHYACMMENVAGPNWQTLVTQADAGEIWAGSGTDATWGFNQGQTVLENVHPATVCAGRHCVLHNPSDHHMRDWPTHFRADRHLMERTCPHGVGHPDPDDVAWHVSEGRNWQGVHGCDGCCARGKQ